MLLLGGALAAGAYAVFGWYVVSGGWGSVAGEEYLLWLPAAASVVLFAGGTLLIRRAHRS